MGYKGDSEADWTLDQVTFDTEFEPLIRLGYDSGHLSDRLAADHSLHVDCHILIYIPNGLIL